MPREQAVKYPRHCAAPWGFAIKLGDDAREHPQRYRARSCGAVGQPHRYLRDAILPFARCGPIKRGIGVCQIPGAGGGGFNIQPIRCGEGSTQSRPVKARITVGWVLHGGDSGARNDLCKFRLPPAEQRPQQWLAPTRHSADRARARKPRNPAPSVEPHNQRFGLIISMMRGDQRGEALAFQPIAQSRITRRPRLGLNVANGYGYSEHFVRNAQFCADLGHHCRFAHAFRSQSMIDGRRSDLLRHQFVRQQQQRQTVWPARNRQPQFGIIRKAGAAPNLAERRAKSRDQILINCTSPQSAPVRRSISGGPKPLPNSHRQIRQSRCRRV